MSSLAFPLRLRSEGVLFRTDEGTAMLSFIQGMAATPGGSWHACPSFGIRDLLESGRRDAEVCRVAKDRTNQALADLGITGYLVAEITSESSGDGSIAVFTVTLKEVRGTRSYSVSLRPAPGYPPSEVPR